MARNKREYSWLDDPFKETKDKEEGKMSGSSKAFIGVGCLVVVILIIVGIVMAVMGLANVASTL